MDTKPDRLTDINDDLKATADDLAADAARVAEIERQKAALEADHPMTAKLAEETEVLIDEMAEKAKIQSALIEKAQGTA
jgi:polyhydroxyalkanoate synthesis regulator phasin